MPTFCRTLLAFSAFAVGLSLAAPARATDYTDIWWATGGVESGWGVNFVQNENIIYATFYLSDTAKKPFWVSSAMYANGAATIYSGALYYSTGSFFGGAWNPADFSATQVGTATFVPTSATTGTLTYTVSNLPGIPNSVVTKSVQRFTFQTIILGGNYVGTGVITTTGCANSANNGTSILDVDPQITQTAGGQLTFTLTFGSETCTLSGPSIQEGQLFKVLGASYNCTNGGANTLNTVANVYEVKATSVGIEGRWLANTGGGCQENGTFSGVLN